MSTNLQWPYYQQPNSQIITYPYVYTLSDVTLQKIREIVKEEIEKALAEPADERPSATVEYEQDGKRWRGTVYLVEDAAEEE